jgi:hypothetical protein
VPLHDAAPSSPVVDEVVVVVVVLDSLALAEPLPPPQAVRPKRAVAASAREALVLFMIGFPRCLGKRDARW